jgi:gamma-glutamylaminecyclotransferase
MKKVFVFGTLKEGFPNFKSNNGVRFRKDFETEEHFPLYLIGERCSPWLILNPGNGCRIQGQVFSVTDAALTEMDRLERINEPDGYRRVEIKVICKESGEQFTVYVYGKPKEQLVESEVSYALAGEYSLKHADLYSNRKP